MSMLTRCLETMACNPHNDLETLTTRLGKDGQHHTDADKVKLKILSMGDSGRFAKDLQALAQLTMYSEQFQEAYNIQTAWDKPDKSALLPRRSPRHYRATKPDVIHRVQRVIPFTTHPTMLRTGFL